MALHLWYLVSGTGYTTLCAFCFHAICKFITAKSTSCCRLVLKKFTLCYVITLRGKTVVKDILWCLYQHVRKMMHAICLSVLILKIIINANVSTRNVSEMCLSYRCKYISHVGPSTQLLIAKVTAFLLAFCQ